MVYSRCLCGRLTQKEDDTITNLEHLKDSLDDRAFANLLLDRNKCDCCIFKGTSKCRKDETCRDGISQWCHTKYGQEQCSETFLARKRQTEAARLKRALKKDAEALECLKLKNEKPWLNNIDLAGSLGVSRSTVASLLKRAERLSKKPEETAPAPPPKPVVQESAADTSASAKPQTEPARPDEQPNIPARPNPTTTQKDDDGQLSLGF